jgi:hypothetical protein
LGYADFPAVFFLAVFAPLPQGARLQDFFGVASVLVGFFVATSDPP